MGKQTKINREANQKLKRLYQDAGVVRCELCGANDFLSFAHRHKRIAYYGLPEMLAQWNQTLLLCVPCHQKLEQDKELTIKTFLKLRGDDQLE